VALILGLLQLLAGGGVMIGNQAARWFGIAIIGLNLVSQLFFIPAYPFWALTIIAFDVFALYGLCVYGDRANMSGERRASRAHRSERTWYCHGSRSTNSPGPASSPPSRTNTAPDSRSSSRQSRPGRSGHPSGILP